MADKQQQFDDIMEAIARLRIAFLKHDMKAPVAIELGDVKDADWFRWSMPRDMVLSRPRMGDTPADAKWVCNIQGVEIIMPAEWRSDAKGKRALYTPDFYEPPPVK